jgi:GT2 family glycosyltransferase
MTDSVSVMIATKNRPSDLAAAVESVLGQSILPNQLIIVDQSQSDESQVRVEKLFAGAASPVREKVRHCYVRDATISGGAVARNRGMEMAQGDISLFLDDDVVLEANFLEELLSVYQRNPRVTGVSGIITDNERPPWAYQLWATVFVRDPFHDERQPIYWEADQLRNAEPIVVRKLGAGLMSFRVEAIRGHRFDEHLTGVSDGEDVDFCARLGPDAVLMIAPRARLTHKASPIGRAQDHWLRRFARANHYLYHRNWERGFRNGLTFVWLNIGLGLVASLASVQRASLVPWRALREGAHEGTRVARPWPVTNGKAPRPTTVRARFGWRL